MRNIYVVGLTPIPRQDAHSVHHVKMAEAFARLGHRVTLVCPRYGAPEEQPAEIYRRYGVAAVFDIVHIPALMLRPGSPLRRVRVEGASVFASFLGWFAAKALGGRLGQGDIVLSTNRPVAFALALWSRVLPHRLRPAVLYESHGFERDAWYLRRLGRLATAIIAIGGAQRDHLRECGVDPAKVSLVGSAVDDRLLGGRIPAPEARRRMGLGGMNNVAVYCGQVSRAKSVEALVQAARWLPEPWRVIIAGWRGDEADWLGPLGFNVEIRGALHPTEVPVLLDAADVLVIPTGASSPYAAFSSPMKLFEYMASGKPIVATKVPSTLDWVDDTQVCLVEPDRPEALARAIQEIGENPERARELGRNARRLAAGHTYLRRAERLLKIADGAAPRDEGAPAGA